MVKCQLLSNFFQTMVIRCHNIVNCIENRIMSMSVQEVQRERDIACVPFCTNAVTTTPIPLSTLASITVPSALVSTGALRFITSAYEERKKRINKKNRWNKIKK